MLMVVYDISDDRRRHKLHSALRAVGRAIQYSLFECDDHVLAEVQTAVGRYARPGDRARIYRLCQRCGVARVSVGTPLEEAEEGSDLVVTPEVEAALRVVVDGPLERGEVRSTSFLEDRICAIGNLRSAFERVRRNRGCAGVDGVGIDRFERELDERLTSLQTDLVAGTYRASPLKHFSIPKPSGGTRVVAVPTVRDRVAQQAVLRVIGPALDAEFEDGSFGYRPGRSVKQAIRRLERLRDQGFVHVVDADIRDYFGQIDHKDLLAMFTSYVKDDFVVGLVTRWINAAPNASKVQGSRTRGVPQGGVISPLLANLYLDAFDERIDELGYKLVRYADDFVVLCRSRVDAERALTDVAVLLKDLHLELNRDKTRLTSFEDGFHFLGHLLIGSVAIKEERAKLLESGGMVGRKQD